MTRAEMRRQQKAQQKLITMTAEAWQKELKQVRDRTFEEAYKALSVNAYKLSIGLTVFLIHDHFGELMLKKVNGKSREERAFDIMMDYWQDVQKGEFSLADVMKMLKDEVGVDFYERE